MYYCIIGSGAVIRNSESNFNCTLQKGSAFSFCTIYFHHYFPTRRRVNRRWCVWLFRFAISYIPIAVVAPLTQYNIIIIIYIHSDIVSLYVNMQILHLPSPVYNSEKIMFEQKCFTYTKELLTFTNKWRRHCWSRLLRLPTYNNIHQLWLYIPNTLFKCRDTFTRRGRAYCQINRKQVFDKI